MGRGNLGNGVDPFADICPVGVLVVRLRKEAADADNGQRCSVGRDIPVHIFIFHARYSLICVSSSGSTQMASAGKADPLAAQHIGAGEHRRAKKNVQATVTTVASAG